jgi:HEPN domain-containing protein
MNVERLEQEARRWLSQAQDDVEAARVSVAAGKHAQAAFLAQQAGEKAVKGLWFRLDLDPGGHSLARLIEELPVAKGKPLAGLLDAALPLDELYVPTRYPNALAGLSPGEAYTRVEAEAAVTQARTIIARKRALTPFYVLRREKGL